MPRFTRRRLGEVAGGSALAGALAAACAPERVPAGKVWPQFRHVVVIMFENRSFDNVLGWLYEDQPPARGQTYAGLAGMNLSNPVPAYADQAGRGPLPAGKGIVMDAPNPDPGEEYQHVNTQLYGAVLPEGNRFVAAPAMSAPFNLPPALPAVAPMSGFVTDYVNAYRVERGRDPTFAEYRQIMDGFTPSALPVFNTLARQFAVFDRWHCAVPSQTFTNRSFFHAASSSGNVNNVPYAKWKENNAETIFDRLEAEKLPWRIYWDRQDIFPLTALIHYPRLSRKLDHVADMDQFYRDARAGTLPAYSFIEPRFMVNENDAHPPSNVVDGVTLPSSALRAEVLLNDVYNAIRTSANSGSNAGNTLFLITFDEHGGCYDHLPPPAAAPPDPTAPPGEAGFRFDRAGVRVPAIAVSAYIEPGTVINAPFEHTSLIRTLARQWDLGTLTQRDQAAPDLGPVFNRRTRRPAGSWPVITPRPLDATANDNLGLKLNVLQFAISSLGAAVIDDASDLERDRATVSQALAQMQRVARRLGL